MSGSTSQAELGEAAQKKAGRRSVFFVNGVVYSLLMALFSLISMMSTKTFALSGVFFLITGALLLVTAVAAAMLLPTGDKGIRESALNALGVHRKEDDMDVEN